jgi:hypothetical protein
MSTSRILREGGQIDCNLERQQVMAAIDGDLLPGNVCPKSENSFPEVDWRLMQAPLLMNGKYTSGGSRVNEAGKVSP